MFDSKPQAALLSIVSNTCLTAGKLVAGLSIGSVGIISEAIHSGMDLLASLMAWVAVRKADQPADREHQFGHGKYENAAAFLEGVLILLAAGIIIWESGQKIISGTEMKNSIWGILVMGISAGVNLGVSQILLTTARKTNSPALEADALHLRTDVYTSVGVFVGMILIHFTHFTLLDPLIAILVAGMIIKAAITLIRQACSSILDSKLPDAEEEQIMQVLEGFAGKFVEVHELRTRKAGSSSLIDLHLVVPRQQRIYRVHELCDQMEKALKIEIKDINILIHAEPCQKDNCSQCSFCQINAGAAIMQGACEKCQWPGCQ